MLMCTFTGTKTRTDSVCLNGVAVDEAVTVEDGRERTAAETDGAIVTTGTFGECAYADVCTFTGTKTRTDSVCLNGVAVDEAVTVEDGCERNPENEGLLVAQRHLW